ncbi:cytochrome c oxidase assembly protein [Cellulomonas sp. PhB143]|uniref:cytochrome c oxidase assembly protein n=1 Tax=Cellulomonas sp. PhB143 TaxID=2485186 RepID=UPI000F974F04|nr:cytochrome c oxidase assembly protein [Cellulomonas sp. PhB143]ROS79065.1 putative copper resistance protein D [Cellulomonas sp. PhB143]
MTSTASRAGTTRGPATSSGDGAAAGARTSDPAIAPGTPWWLVAAAPGALLVAVLAVLGAGTWSRAFVPTFVDPGALALYGLPLATVLTELAAAATFGSLVLAACVLTPGKPVRRALSTAGVASGAWALLALAQLVMRYSTLSGTAITDPTYGPQLGKFVTQIELGQTYLGIIVVVAALSAVVMAVRTANGAMVTAVLAVVAFWIQAGTGHASGSADHDLAVSTMFLHLSGAALWIGGLAGLLVGRVRGGVGRQNFATAVSRYSSIAVWCYVMVGVSGIANAAIRIGSLADLGTRYGQLIVVKATLLVVLGLFGYVHRETVIKRLRLSPRAPAARTAAGRTSSGGDQGAEKVVTRLFWRLASVELLVMGAVSGVAVALGSTAPPVPDEPFADPTAAEIVTGYPLPPEPTLADWAFGHEISPLWLFAGIAGIVVYLRWTVRLRRRGDRWPVGRAVSWCLGMLTLLWATNGGAAVYGHLMFSAHMIQHMTLAMIVPIFLVLSAPVTLLVRAIPARKDGSKGPREWVLGLVDSRWGHFFANPVVSAVMFAGSMIAFYFTGAFELALTTHLGHALMVVHFTLVGYLFVNALVGIDPGPKRLAYPQRLLLLLATMAFHAFFGVVLMSGSSLLVADYFGLTGRPWGPSAIVDQQRGGGIAWGIGEIPTLALAFVVALSWSRSDEKEARRRDRRVARTGDVEMDEYNAMLARLKERDDRTADRP